jgi:hypothetical protein
MLQMHCQQKAARDDKSHKGIDVKSIDVRGVDVPVFVQTKNKI